MSEQLQELAKTSQEQDQPTQIEPVKRESNGQIIPGQRSLNPNGRPKNTSITALLREKLETIPDGYKKTYKELMVENMLKQSGLIGDFPTTKLVMNYVDGMPKQSIQHSGEVGTYTSAVKNIFAQTDDDFADETADSEVDEPRSQDSQQEQGSSTPNAQPVAGEVQPTSPAA